MVKIILNNHKSRLVGPTQLLHALRQEWAMKSPGYFFSPAFRKGHWDGYVRYITETGLFATGLIHELKELLDKRKEAFTIDDNRDVFKDLHEVTELGGMEFRGYQADAVKAILTNKFEGVRFQRGIFNEATNAGKSLIAGGLFASFNKKRRGLFLVNNKTLFTQAYGDLTKLLGTEWVGRVNSDYTDWKRINVCMVQTLGIRMKKNPKIRTELAKTDIVVVDEADEIIGRKDCQEILNYCYNAPIRAALTGTADKHKNKRRNKELVAFFGPILHTITNKELVDAGVSTPPDIRITMGNRTIRIEEDYKLEYEKGIIRNKARHRQIWKRVNRHIKRDRLPTLILFKEHKHGYNILRAMPDNLRGKFTHAIVHHKTKNREEILHQFNEGKIDILIASMIIKRGKNLPLIQVLVNAAGGDSQVNLLQILGRALRKHESKDKVYIEDFWDWGRYLQRHSRHRVIYYKNQGFEVKEIYKAKLKLLRTK